MNSILKIIVLGASGFVGKRLLDSLKKEGKKVYAVYSENVDLLNYKSVKKYFNNIKPDVIINCAAHTGSVHYVTTHSADVCHDNIQMSLNIYKGVQKVCSSSKIINPFSNCSYPGDSNIQRERNWLMGEVHESVFAYGNYKRTLYAISKSYYKQYGTRSVNLIFPNAFGPGDSADPNKTHALNGMIIRMIQAQKRGDKEFTIWGSGKPVREWIYVDDMVKILKSGIYMKGELIFPINVAQNKGFSIKDSAEIIAKLINFEGRLAFDNKYQDGDPVKILDNKKFKVIFPKFKFIDYRKGVKETINYYKSIL